GRRWVGSRRAARICSGVRCAEPTAASWAVPGSPGASAAACMTGQSESEPITMPTRGVLLWSLTGVSQVSAEPGGRVAGALQGLVEVVAEGVHVSDLAAGPPVLAVQVHLEVRIAGHHVGEPVIEATRVPRATEDVDHHGPGRARLRRSQRQVHHGTQVVLELRGDRAVLGPVTGVV